MSDVADWSENMRMEKRLLISWIGVCRIVSVERRREVARWRGVRPWQEKQGSFKKLGSEEKEKS